MRSREILCSVLNYYLPDFISATYGDYSHETYATQGITGRIVGSLASCSLVLIHTGYTSIEASSGPSHPRIAGKTWDRLM